MPLCFNERLHKRQSIKYWKIPQQLICGFAAMELKQIATIFCYGKFHIIFMRKKQCICFSELSEENSIALSCAKKRYFCFSELSVENSIAANTQICYAMENM